MGKGLIMETTAYGNAREDARESDHEVRRAQPVKHGDIPRSPDTSPYPPAVAEVLASNRAFVTDGRWADHAAPGMPGKRLAVVTCMDTRLTRLLPAALGLRDGDAKIIKVAGATIVEPYGEAMRSLLIAVTELGVTDIMVVGHTGCGTCGMRASHMLDELEQAGVPRKRIEAAIADDPRAATFLNGFEVLEDEVAASVRKIREHPLMPEHVRVFGFTIDIKTGELTSVTVTGEAR